jgi:uncharacterized protein YaaN involved in tellurite resistance
MKESPFARKSSVAAPVVPLHQDTSENALAVRQSTFVAGKSKALPVIRWTSDDIDRIGSEASKRNTALTDRVTKKMTLNRLGDIGSLLADLQTKANGMEPGNLLNKGGVFGWFQQKFVDIRKELTIRFTTVDEAFEKLVGGISAHVGVLREWEKDDDVMYAENYERFRDFLQSKNEIEAVIAELTAAVNAWPDADPADPEAVMKAQQRLAAQELLNRAEVRRESILRSMTKCETNGPEILMMKSVSSKLIAKFTADATDIVPEIKREIAKEIQRLNTMDAIAVQQAFKDFANTTLTQGAQRSKDMVLAGNKAFNEATITTNTISTIQNSVRDMVTGAQTIMEEARARRDQEQRQIEANQKLLLADLQKRGAV